MRSPTRAQMSALATPQAWMYPSGYISPTGYIRESSHRERNSNTGDSWKPLRKLAMVRDASRPLADGAPGALYQDLFEKTLEAQLADLEKKQRELPEYKTMDRKLTQLLIERLKEKIRIQDEAEAPREELDCRLERAKEELAETPESRPALRELRQLMVQRLENEIRIQDGVEPEPIQSSEGIAKRARQEMKEAGLISYPDARQLSASEQPDARKLSVSEQIENKFVIKGLHPAVAVVVALWYGLVAGGAMSRGFAYLYERSTNDYPLAQNLMWIVGMGIGVALAACLARNSRWTIGVVSSGIMSCMLLSLLFLIPSDQPGQVSVFGFTPSASNFMTGVAILTLLSGLLGTSLGIAMRADETFSNTILGIRHRHWFWLWLPLYAWVAIFPTAIYYVWLELTSTVFVFVHPWLLLDDAWTGGWTVSFGLAGFAAIIYGIGLSLDSVSSTRGTNVRTRTRVLRFLLGTLVMVGPVANVLFRIAIHSLKHLPDGITANPWWVLR